MSNNHVNNIINSQKSSNLTFSLALVFIVCFSILNLGGNNKLNVPILGFHGVIKSQNVNVQSYQQNMDYLQQDLEKLLEYLVVHNYWFLTSQDLYNYFLVKSQEIPAEHWNQKPIMITFDDGYKTVYTNLLPILSKLENKYHKKIKVVLFINPGTLANQNSIASTHLGCQELRAGLQKGFFDIQSHGENHKDLTELPRYQLVNELLRARINLRKCTQDLDPEQKVASHFAYPYGAYNKQVEEYVAKYYLSSYLYNDKILNHTCFKDNYRIPRLMVNRQRSVKQLIEIVERFNPIKDKAKDKRKC